MSLIYLIVMSTIAGILTGIVGMAALTLYPVLISVGVLPITANATITVSQVAGGLGTVLSSLRELHGHWKQTLQITAVNTIGGVLGALILIHSSNAGFKKFVPFFILLAGIMILAPSKNKKDAKQVSKWIRILSWIGVFLVGIYDGYFGAGAGLLMIAILSKVIDQKYVIYNAMRNFASFIGNLIYAIMFIFMLQIDWKVIIPLIIGLFIGGYIGPIVVRYIPSQIMKYCVGVFAIVLSFVLGYQAYFK
mgnify:FL=1